MKKLRQLAGIKEAIYESCEIKDQKLINMLALMIPISAIIAGYAFYTFIYFFTELNIISAPIGFTIFLLILWHDQSLMSTNSLNQIIGRIVASILMGSFILMPFKTEQNMTSIKERIEHLHSEKNAEVFIKMNSKIEEIEKTGERLNAEMVKTAKSRSSDAQPFYDARRALNAFNESKQERIDAIKRTYEPMIEEHEVTKMDALGFYAVNMFSKEAPSELVINLAILVCLLFIEASPAIIRMTIEDGEYFESYNHYQGMRRTIRDSIRATERSIAKDDENALEKIIEIQIKKEKEKLINDQFSEPQRLIELDRVSKMLKDKQIKPDEQPPDDTPPADNASDDSEDDEIPTFQE